MIYPRTQPRQPFTSESSNFSKIFQVAVAAVAAAVDGIITCTVYPEVPPRVEYALSDLIEGIKKQHSPRQKLIELGGGCTILISQYLNQAHQAGQAQRQSRDVGDGQQGGNQCHKVWDQL